MKTHAASVMDTADKREEKTLILYHKKTCSFCLLVRHAIDELGVEVELRDIAQSQNDREALLAARNRKTVPVLRIIDADGSENWLPESRDIVRFLQQYTSE